MIDFGEWKFAVQYEAMYDRILAVLFRKREDGSRDVLHQDGTIKNVAFGESTEKASFALEILHLQALMDGLWTFGIRPKDRRYEHELELKDAHLQDMRKLVFKGKP